MGDVEHFLLHFNGMAEERKDMVRLMNEIMVGWQVVLPQAHPTMLCIY